MPAQKQLDKQKELKQSVKLSQWYKYGVIDLAEGNVIQWKEFDKEKGCLQTLKVKIKHSSLLYMIVFTVNCGTITNICLRHSTEPVSSTKLTKTRRTTEMDARELGTFPKVDLLGTPYRPTLTHSDFLAVNLPHLSWVARSGSYSFITITP